MTRRASSTAGEFSIDEMPTQGVYKAARKLVEDDGVLSRQELTDFNLPFYPREFEDVTNEVTLDEAGFRLVACERNDSRLTPQFVEYEASSQDEEALERFVTSSSAMIEAVFEPVFRRCLRKSLSPGARDATCEALWTYYRRLIRSNPSAFSLAPAETYLLLQKK